MQKIIVAFDGLKYSESAASYAIGIAKKKEAMLVGVFLEDFTYHSFKITDLAGDDGTDEDRVAYLTKADKDKRNNSVKTFTLAAEGAGLKYKVHRDKNIAIQELLHETLYADLLVIQNNETLTHYSEDAPTRFIKMLLEKVECPVLLVPDVYADIEKVILLYDGEPSSLFAMKQFACLFKDEYLSILVFSAVSDNAQHVVTDAHLLKEWLREHFAIVNFKVGHGGTRAEIMKAIKEHISNPLVVLGAYERGTLSRWLKKSMADCIIDQVNVPIFIAHK